MTNQLKELISFRQWNMMDETHVMNEVKETCCYVTSDLRNDMEVCRYVAPMKFHLPAHSDGCALT